MANLPEITRNQMEFMRAKKKKEIVNLNGISAEIQPYMFPPVSPHSYSTRVLLDNMQFEPGERVLEIGTGCGILSVFAAKQGAKVDGVDILPECVQFSLGNAIRNDVFRTTRFFYSDMFSNIDKRYDTILCNLPILEGDIPDGDPRWYSLFDPEFKFHNRLFDKGRGFAPRIIMAHADLTGRNDFDKIEILAERYGWISGVVKSKEYSEREWRSYEFKYIGENKL
jgi:methylase of polypeptide subunit release factors